MVGVLPAGFKLPTGLLAVVLPLAPDPQHRSRDDHYLQVLGRLAPGVSVEGAHAELDGISDRLAVAYPDSDTDRKTRVETLHDSLVAGLRAPVLLLFGAVLLVLVIACANVANMLIARAATRTGELAIRVALGASRGRLLRQLLTESALLALCGGGLGVLLATWGVDVCAALLPKAANFHAEVDARVVVFALTATTLSVMLFGLLPALRASRTDVQGVLKEASPGVMGGKNRLKSALVVAQVALSFALLAGAGLLARSFWQVAGVEPGFDASHVATLQIVLPPGKDPEVFYPRLLERVAEIPGVTASGVTDYLPLSRNNTNGDFSIEGRTFPKRAGAALRVHGGQPGLLRHHGDADRRRARLSGQRSRRQLAGRGAQPDHGPPVFSRWSRGRRDRQADQAQLVRDVVQRRRDRERHQALRARHRRRRRDLGAAHADAVGRDDPHGARPGQPRRARRGVAPHGRRGFPIPSRPCSTSARWATSSTTRSAIAGCS